jgi:hypothetical protein
LTFTRYLDPTILLDRRKLCILNSPIQRARRVAGLLNATESYAEKPVSEQLNPGPDASGGLRAANQSRPSEPRPPVNVNTHHINVTRVISCSWNYFLHGQYRHGDGHHERGFHPAAKYLNASWHLAVLDCRIACVRFDSVGLTVEQDQNRCLRQEHVLSCQVTALDSCNCTVYSSQSLYVYSTMRFAFVALRDCAQWLECH